MDNFIEVRKIAAFRWQEILSALDIPVIIITLGDKNV